MRRLALSLVPLFLLAACSEQPTPTASSVIEGPLFNTGAVVHHDEIGCAVVDGSGNWYPTDWSLPCGTEVATFSQNVNSNLTVHASGVPNPTGKTVHWGPYNPGDDWKAQYPEIKEPGPWPCFVLGPDYDLDNPLYTVNWKAWVTPNGEATLSCHYSKKWEFQWPAP